MQLGLAEPNENTDERQRKKNLFLQSQQKVLTEQVTLYKSSNKFPKSLSIKFQRVKPTDNLGMSQIKPKDKTTNMKASQRLSEQW